MYQHGLPSRPCPSSRDDGLLAAIPPPLTWWNDAVCMVESNASAGLASLPKDGSLSSLFNSRDTIVPQLGGGRVVLACLSPQTNLGKPDQIPSSTCAGQDFWGGGESQVGTAYDHSAGTVTRNSHDTSKTR